MTPAVAQSPELPPLALTVAAEDVEQLYSSELVNAGYAFVRCTTEPGGAGIWYRALASAAILDPEYYNEELRLAEMNPAYVLLGTVANLFPPASSNWGNSYLEMPWTIPAQPGTVEAALARMLLIGGQGSSQAVVGNAVPLPHATPAIVHKYHLEPFSLHGWRQDAGTGAFNLDAIRQLAVWDNVSSSSQWSSPDEFFGSEEYLTICKYPVQLTITLVGARDSTVAPGPGIVPPTIPVLTNYPVAAPKVTLSGPALITYAGTNSTYSAFTPPGPGFEPIFTVPQGGTVHLPASGFAPNMQIALCSESTTPSQRFELTAAWSAFGWLKLNVPEQAVPGFFEARYSRNQVPGPNGPVWLPWRVIPADQRARLNVTQS